MKFSFKSPDVNLNLENASVRLFNLQGKIDA